MVNSTKSFDWTCGKLIAARLPNPTPGSCETAGPAVLDPSTWTIEQLAAQAGAS